MSEKNETKCRKCGGEFHPNDEVFLTRSWLAKQCMECFYSTNDLDLPGVF